MIAQFSINGFFPPHRLDRNDKGCEYSFPSNIETVFFELNLRSKKWLLGCSYNLQKILIKEHLKNMKPT